MLQISSRGFLPPSIWTRYFRLGHAGAHHLEQPSVILEDTTGSPESQVFMQIRSPIQSRTGERKTESISRTRKLIDICIVMGTGTLCLVTVYWLVNNDFAILYAVTFAYTALATWGLSSAWLKNCFLCLSCFALLLAVSEVILSYATPAELESLRASTRYTRGYSEPLRRNGGELGYQPNSGRKIEVWKTLGNESIFDVVYTINRQGFRHTPGFGQLKGSKTPIVFFGGSYAFGEGLNDDETLPYFVAEKTKWSRPVLNLAFSGYGPHQMLRSLELEQLHDFGYETIESAVYVAIPGHANRAAGEIWWDPTGPKYALDEPGSLQYQGHFADVSDDFINIYYRYLQIVQVARRSRVIDRAINFMSGVQSSDPSENAMLMAQIISRSAAILSETYHADLTVLFWDDDSALSSLIVDALVERGIHVIEVSDFIPLSERHRYEIPLDGHPNAAANELLAEQLARSLQIAD